MWLCLKWCMVEVPECYRASHGLLELSKMLSLASFPIPSVSICAWVCVCVHLGLRICVYVRLVYHIKESVFIINAWYHFYLLAMKCPTSLLFEIFIIMNKQEYSITDKVIMLSFLKSSMKSHLPPESVVIINAWYHFHLLTMNLSILSYLISLPLANRTIYKNQSLLSMLDITSTC